MTITPRTETNTTSDGTEILKVISADGSTSESRLLTVKTYRIGSPVPGMDHINYGGDFDTVEEAQEASNSGNYGTNPDRFIAEVVTLTVRVQTITPLTV